MSAEKIAAIKAKRLAKKRTTIKVDDELDPGVLVSLVVYKTVCCRGKYMFCLKKT